VGAYWIMIAISSSAVILTCYAVHYFIELPAMNATSKATAGIRKILYISGFRRP
jgi:peptidoglycan/LPS O-acetylase OafA/YrhL